MTTEDLEPCMHDFDWVNPILDSDDDMDEVLICLECGLVKWAARDIANFQGPIS